MIMTRRLTNIARRPFTYFNSLLVFHPRRSWRDNYFTFPCLITDYIVVVSLGRLFSWTFITLVSIVHALYVKTPYANLIFTNNEEDCS